MNKLQDYDMRILALRDEEKKRMAKHLKAKQALAETRRELAAAITARRKAKYADLIL